MTDSETVSIAADYASSASSSDDSDPFDGVPDASLLSSDQPYPLLYPLKLSNSALEDVVEQNISVLVEHAKETKVHIFLPSEVTHMEQQGGNRVL